MIAVGMVEKTVDYTLAVEHTVLVNEADTIPPFDKLVPLPLDPSK